MHLIQQVCDEDEDLRVEMSELLISNINDQENDGLIFFSDKASFHLSAVINKYNCRLWAETNPFVTIDVAMNLTAWCAMSNEEIIGPFFVDEDTVNQENHFDMLENYLYPIFQRKRLTKRIFFQQNGWLVHLSKWVRAVLG